MTESQGFRIFVLYFPRADHPLFRYRDLSLLSPRLVVQEAGSGVCEPGGTRNWDRTPRQTRTSGAGFVHFADDRFDPVDGGVGVVGGILHSKNSVRKIVRRHA